MNDKCLIEVIIKYLSDGTLPRDEKEACHLILGSQKFTVADGILCYIEGDKTLRVVVPETDRKRLFNEAHARSFGGHLRGAKIHSHTIGGQR